MLLQYCFFFSNLTPNELKFLILMIDFCTPHPTNIISQVTLTISTVTFRNLVLNKDR